MRPDTSSANGAPASGAGSGYLATAATTQAYTYSTTTGLKTAENLQLQSVGTAGVISSSYTYTTAGRLLTATIGGVTETYSFSEAGNLLGITSTGGPATTFTYTENRLATMVVGGVTTGFTFDAAQRWRTGPGPERQLPTPSPTPTPAPAAWLPT